MEEQQKLQRAHHAAYLFVANRVVRVFWVAGLSVYVVQQNNAATIGGETWRGDVRGAILDADRKWDEHENR